MIIQRRNFLIGLGSMLAAPAIVHAANIMPVRAYDPLIRGIRWQSWPYDQPHPDEFATGTIGIDCRDVPGPLRRTSHYLKRLDWYRGHYPDLVWKPLSHGQCAFT